MTYMFNALHALNDVDRLITWPGLAWPHLQSVVVPVAVGVAVPLGVMLLAALVVVTRQAQHARHRSLLGQLLVPGVGPLATLLVTDIQARLWALT